MHQRGHHERSAFLVEQASANKKAARPCDVRHPGLCRTVHETIYFNALRFARNLFDLVAGMEHCAGECLIEICTSRPRQQEPHLCWLMRNFGYPKRMHFAEASKHAEDDNHFVDIVRPVIRITNFGIAAKLLTRNGKHEVFTVRLVKHRSSEGRLWRTRDVGRGEPLSLSGLTRTRVKGEVDPLKQALAMASGLPPARLSR